MFRKQAIAAAIALGLCVASSAFAGAPACAPASESQEGAMQRLAPRAIAWAEAEARAALAGGIALSPELGDLARAVGVRRPGAIRLRVVESIALPSEPLLAQAAARVGLVPASAGAMTLGYAVVIRRDQGYDRRLLAHEFRHVAQYEACGGIAPFLARHLGHLAEHGYRDAPFEVDARAAEGARH